MELQTDGWAVIELMGHRTRVGKLSEVEIAGTPMLRIDIPIADKPEDFVTEYYGGPAVYSILPTSEEVIREQHFGTSLPARLRRFDEPAMLGHLDEEDVSQDTDGNRHLNRDDQPIDF